MVIARTLLVSLSLLTEAAAAASASSRICARRLLSAAFSFASLKYVSSQLSRCRSLIASIALENLPAVLISATTSSRVSVVAISRSGSSKILSAVPTPSRDSLP